MAQRKILIDTNAYLRLAYTIHPLLFTPFGDEEYCLYILRELNEELENPKLQSKYSWVMEMPYTQNRQYIPKISRVDDKAIRQTYGYIWEYVKTSLPGPSRVDVLYIAYAFEMQYPLVTDDQDMIRLAMVYGAKVIQTLTLLRMMLDSHHIDLKRISDLFDYWNYNSDHPANFHGDRRKLFPDLVREITPPMNEK